MVNNNDDAHANHLFDIQVNNMFRHSGHTNNLHLLSKMHIHSIVIKQIFSKTLFFNFIDFITMTKIL